MKESHGRDRERSEEEGPAVGRREVERNSGKQKGVNQRTILCCALKLSCLKIGKKKRGKPGKTISSMNSPRPVRQNTSLLFSTIKLCQTLSL